MIDNHIDNLCFIYPTSVQTVVHHTRPVNQIRYILHTKIGDGPRRLIDTDDSQHSLIGDSGQPLRVGGVLTEEGAELEQRQKKQKRDRNDDEPSVAVTSLADSSPPSSSQ